MRVISPLDLRRSLGSILDAASAGERFLVERDRRPLAMLVSVEDGRRLESDPADARDRRLAALDRLDALGRRQAGGDGVPGAAGRPQPAPETPASPAASRATPPPRPAASPLVRPGAGPGTRPVDRYEAERRRHAAERNVVAGG